MIWSHMQEGRLSGAASGKRRLRVLSAPVMAVVCLAALAGLAPDQAFAQLGGAKKDDGPPKDVRLVEKKKEQLTVVEMTPLALTASAVTPQKWKHAEIDNFIIHYRRVTEAQRAVREVEYTLWFVAGALNIPKERYATKSHVFIFQDRKEWQQFLQDVKVPQWTGSFAYGGELYLFIGSATEAFDSQMLAHEVAHCAISRFYPGKRLPLWLNEGFAEYIGSASIATRTKQYMKGVQNKLHKADMPLGELIVMAVYPEDREKVTQLYQTSERLVRFLMTELPKERIAAFLEAMFEAEGSAFPEVLIRVYGGELESYKEFEKRFNRFTH